RFTQPVALDFGAIGKGWALDRAARVLREHGVTRALLHGGTSSVVTLGGPWRVALDDRAAVDLTDASLGVSAPAGRTIGRGADVRGHILDPRTGRSATTLGAAVSGPSAAVCDAWSTALVVDPCLAADTAFPTGYRAHVNAGSGFICPTHPNPISARRTCR
ncbi:MAG TPA: FAD:protein FMN transferase, partial [Phycisphaerales bacterium]|nr:FAD:protein FMN transferase [Phycisphaerales bacterium]